MTIPRLLASLVLDAGEAGWSVTTSETGDRVSARFLAPDRSQTINTNYLAGAFTDATVEFPSQADRKVLLRNLSAARKQIFNSPDKRPVKEQLRRSPKRSTRFVTDPNSIGAPMDSNELLPFAMTDADAEILLKLTGRKVFWRNSEMNRIESLIVPEVVGATRIVRHPQNGRRMLQVMATLIYLDRIRRVL